jgi:hypothetical protein
MASTPDNRDKRDPERLGLALLGMKAGRSDCPSLSAAADKLDHLGIKIDDYADTPVDHADLRNAELRARADNGDKFAIAMLNGGSLAEDPVD